MEDWVLNTIKRDVKKIKMSIEVAKCLEEMEKNKKIQDYLKLRGIESITEMNSNKKVLSDDEILLKAFKDNLCFMERELTNKIYVFLYAYIYELDPHAPDPQIFYKVDIDDPEAEYVVYQDIEESHPSEMTVSDFKKFEKDNTVLYGTSVNKVRGEFVKEAINTNQKQAKQLVLKKYSKKK